jgi:hypothetical protein
MYSIRECPRRLMAATAQYEVLYYDGQMSVTLDVEGHR